jgi:GAF domain-containing protein/CheY-like chemotaxis protein
MLSYPNRPARVLIVDDEPEARENIRLALHASGLDLLEADSVTAASAKLAEGNIQAVILDNHLPDRSGMELLEEIRANPAIAHIKVLFLTNDDRVQEKVKAFQRGVDDYLCKPFHPAELQARLSRLLKLDQAERSLINAYKHADVLQEIIKRISEDITSHPQLEAHLDFILQKLAQFVEYDSASIMLKRDEGLVIAAQRGFHSEAQQFSTEMLEKLPHIQEVFQQGHAVVIPHTDEDKRWYALPKDEYIHSWMGIPLIYKGRTLGILNVDSSIPNFYSPEHLNQASAFASHAAIAIANAVIFQQTQRQAELSRSLVEVSQRLTEKTDLKEQMDALWDFVVRVLRAPIFFVALYSPHPDRLHFEIAYDMGEKFHPQDVLLRDKQTWGLSGQVFVRDRPVIWLDQGKKDATIDEMGIHLRLQGRPSLSCVSLPLEVSGKVIGVITIQSDQPGAWSNLEIDAFRTLASQVAVNIQNTSLLEDVQQKSDFLQNSYQASESITSQLDPDEVIRQVVINSCERMGVWWACLILMDADGAPRSIETAHLYRKPKPDEWVRKDGLSVKSFLSKTPEFLEDVQESALVNPAMFKDGVRAAACLPLYSTAQCYGVLWIHYPDTHEFPEGEKAAWMLYANQAAIAYENALKVVELKNLHASSEQLVKAHEPLEIMTALTRNARDIFSCDSAVFFPFDRAERNFQFRQAVCERVPMEAWRSYLEKHPDSAMPESIFVRDEFVQVKNVLESHRKATRGHDVLDLLSQMGVVSSEIVELHIGSEVQGALLVNYHHPYVFAESDRQKALTLVNQAALALEKVYLIAQLERVKLTSQAATHWTMLGNLKSTFESIVQGTMDTLGCQVVTLYTYDQEREKFDFPPTMAGVRNPEKVTELNYVARDSMPYKVIQMDHPCVKPDALQGPLVGQFTRREEIKSWVGVPLISAGKKVGVMFINFRQPHNFSEDDLSNIDLFSNLAAIAISYAQQYEKLQSNQREAASRLSLDFMEAMNSSYLHAVRRNIAILGDLIERIDAQLKKAVPASEIQKYITQVQETLAEARAIPIYPLPDEETFEPMSINTLVRERANQFRKKKGKYEDKEFETIFQVDERVRVRGNSELLRRAIDILINNSVEAVENQPVKKITLHTSLTADGDEVMIEVRDTGCGIPEKLQARLIDGPIEKKKGEHGMGIGLYLAGIIFNMHKGRIWLKHSQPGETVMCMAMPVAR